MFESEADRLAVLQAVGGEEFDTGHTDRLWAVFDIPSFDTEGLPIPVRNRKPVLTCRESDVVLHDLVKQSPVTRVSDGVQYLVRDFEYDGTGMVVISLGAQS